MRLRSLLLFLLVGCSFSLYSQPTIPVDPLTGRPSISIPLWTLSEGNLSVPISLTYQGTGIRVKESEGTAGMGWNLSAGGVVGRQVRGLPDDYSGTGSDVRRGWLFDNLAQTINSFVPSADGNPLTCTDEGPDYTFIDNLGYAKDTEPDQFYFSAPGLQGEFVFGADGLPKLMPWQDLKIDVTQNASGQITSINITSNTGIVYTFGAPETVTRSTHLHPGTPLGTAVTHFASTYYYYQTPLTYSAAWQLVQITSPGGANITLSHVTQEMIQSKQDVVVVPASNEPDTLYNITDKFIPRQIDFIQTDAVTANFEWAGEVLAEVRIHDNHFNTEKRFGLSYIYVKQGGTTSQFPITRAFLKEIKQESNCISYPSFVFDYAGVSAAEPYTIPLPFDDRNKRDLWGFYNGTSSTDNPDIYVYNGQSNAERYRIQQIPGQTPSQTLSGAGRAVGAGYISTGSLQSIIYPTGAVASITWEPHTYFDALANASYQGGGIRVQRVTLSGFEKGSESIVTDYEYLAENGQSSGKLLYRPVFAFADGSAIIRTTENLAPDGGLLYSRSTVKQTGKGKTVYEFSTPAVYPSVSESDWLATEAKVVRPAASPCADIGNQHGGFYTSPFAPNMNYDFERGLPSRIADYTESGTLVQERTFTYQRHPSTPVIVKGLRFEKFPAYTNYLYGHYSLMTNVGKVTLTETARRADDVTPTNLVETMTTYAYSSVHKLLESVSVTNSDGIIHKTKYKYAKDFSTLTNPNTSKPEAVAIKNLNDNFRHGEVVETIQYRKEGTNPDVPIGASLNFFKDFGSGKTLPHTSLVFPAITGFDDEAYVTGSPQELWYNASYIPVSVVQSYNPLGLPLSVTDNKKNKSGIHYGFSNSAALAAVSNALAEETVYDGFETSSGFSLTVSGGATTVAGWTGQNAKSVLDATELTRSNVQKGSNLYRFSCMAKASAAVTITFSAIGGSTVSQSVSYSDVNQWKYLEGTLDVSALGSSFTFRVTFSAAAVIDDIRFLPASASISTMTYDPLNGKTSVTDDAGFSAFTDYDERGRVKYTRDRDKNIVQVNEYRYKAEPVPQVRSNFTCNVPEYNLTAGTGVTFTSPENCLTPLTYSWSVKKGGTTVFAGTSATLGYTFPLPGQYEVELIVTHPQYGASKYIASYCVDTQPLDLSLQITDNMGLSPPEAIYSCNGNIIKQLTVVYNSGGCGDTNLEYGWEYNPEGSIYWYPVFGGTGNTVEISNSFPATYRCTVTQVCEDEGVACFGATTVLERTVATYYVNNEPCP